MGHFFRKNRRSIIITICSIISVLLVVLFVRFVVLKRPFGSLLNDEANALTINHVAQPVNTSSAGSVSEKSVSVGSQDMISVTYETSSGEVTRNFEQNATTADLPIPNREGYTFIRWDTNQEQLTNGMNLKAVWNKTGFFVTYDASPGKFEDGKTEKSILFNYGENSYKDPELETVYNDYVLNGWKTTDGEWNISEYALNKKPDDITVSAVYAEATVYVTYHSNNGEGLSEKWMCASDGEAKIKQCMFQNPGKLFAGWNEKEDGTGKLFNENDVVRFETNKELYAQWEVNAGITLTIDNITINDDVGRIDYSDGVLSDNGIYRLYIINNGSETLAAETPAATHGTILFTGKDLVKSQFVIRTVQNGSETDICDIQYLLQIHEPDESNEVSRNDIKGILPDPINMYTDEFKSLGVRQVAYNLYLSQLLNPSGEQVAYQYNGGTYFFNADIVKAYDHTVNYFKKNNYKTTMIVLNDKREGSPLIHEKATDPTATLFMLSTNPAALEMEKAIGSFLAARYEYVSNWVIGNEIDARHPWNYIETDSIDEYVSEFSKGFRAFYTGITTTNKNARVFFSLTSNWNRADEHLRRYKARDILDIFADKNKDIEWHLAFHPYNNPVIDSTTWTSDHTTLNIDTPSITMKNIAVLTEYMQTKRMLNPDGSSKSIILSELGYTSANGNEQNQAASLVYAYRKAAANEHIDAFLYSREIDSAIESSEGLASGIKNIDGSKKLSWDWYSAMGTGRERQVITEAANITQ